MTDLQDELNEIGSTLNHWPAIVEAARRVANPDTFAAKQAFPHVDAADVVGIVDAALGITEEDE